MLAQCVLVATTLLYSGAKFHSFLYTGSKTVRVNMESCCGGMSTRLKQRAVTESLSRCPGQHCILNPNVIEGSTRTTDSYCKIAHTLFFIRREVTLWYFGL
jgi:hypothetical protein